MVAMVSSQGWTASRDELLQINLLDWSYDNSRDGTLPDLGTYLDEHEGADDESTEAAMNALASARLVDTVITMGGLRNWGLAPSAEGSTALRARRDRRQNKSARAVAAREALLDWFYEQQRDGVHFAITTNVLNDPRGHFEGDPFTDQEIDDASAFLLDKGLVKSAGASWGAAVLRGEITPLGEEVVENHEGSIRAWSSAQNGGGAPQFVTHFNAPVSGQVGIGNSVTQTQTTTSGIDTTTLLALLADVREAASEIRESDRAYLLSYVDVIQAEATSPEPDPTMLERSGGRVKQLAAKVGDAGLSASVGALVGYIATALGLG